MNLVLPIYHDTISQDICDIKSQLHNIEEEQRAINAKLDQILTELNPKTEPVPCYDERGFEVLE